MNKEKVINYVKSHPIPVVISVVAMAVVSPFVGFILTGVAGVGGYFVGKEIEKK